MKPPAGIRSIDVETIGPQGIPGIIKKITVNFMKPIKPGLNPGNFRKKLEKIL